NRDSSHSVNKLEQRSALVIDRNHDRQDEVVRNRVDPQLPTGTIPEAPAKGAVPRLAVWGGLRPPLEIAVRHSSDRPWILEGQRQRIGLQQKRKYPQRFPGRIARFVDQLRGTVSGVLQLGELQPAEEFGTGFSRDV